MQTHGLTLGFILATALSATTFTFDTLAPYTIIPLTIPSDGISATFSSPQSAVFFVAPIDPLSPSFATLTGNILVSNNSPPDDLEIQFTQLLQSVNLVFALRTSLSEDVFMMDTLRGETLVGSIVASGSVRPGFEFSEGNISLNGGIFDRVRLSSSAQDFAIDNVTVSPASTIPEPSSGVLVSSAIGIAAITLTLARIRAKH
jgi:hypothetical protein